MAFIVETGAVVLGANSYDTVANFRAYHLERGLTVDSITYPDATVEGWLIYGTAWLDDGYAWKGNITTLDTNRLRWPRYGAVDDEGRTIPSDEIPRRLKWALHELAWRHKARPLNTIQQRSDFLESLSAGSVSLAWSDTAPPGEMYPLVEKYLSGLHQGVSGGGMQIVKLIPA